MYATSSFIAATNDPKLQLANLMRQTYPKGVLPPRFAASILLRQLASTGKREAFRKSLIKRIMEMPKGLTEEQQIHEMYQLVPGLLARKRHLSRLEVDRGWKELSGAASPSDTYVRDFVHVLVTDISYRLSAVFAYDGVKRM